MAIMTKQNEVTLKHTSLCRHVNSVQVSPQAYVITWFANLPEGDP